MAMNCDMFQENASRFMDGSLDAAGQAALFAHLSACADCRSFLALSVRAREVMQKDLVDLPEGLEEELFERLARRPVVKVLRHDPAAPFWRREVRFSWPLAAAAMLIVALASVLFSVLFLRSNPVSPTLESVLGKAADARGRQAVVVIYQLPEEHVVTPAPAEIMEVRARTVAN
jgi:anti-sigma factor RsiW